METRSKKKFIGETTNQCMQQIDKKKKKKEDRTGDKRIKGKKNKKKTIDLYHINTKKTVHRKSQNII